MKKDVVALGELLIDFTDHGMSKQNNNIFEANPGGAPCNVLAMLNRFGHATAFIGKVGNDIFGEQLKKELDALSIDTTYLSIDEKVNTTLAFVKNKDNGERTFSFYRNPGADMMLSEGDITENAVKDVKIFHFGSLSMTHDIVRRATKKAVKIAKENDVTISFDPNLRESLWNNLEEARVQIAYGLSNCDILKIADNEITWFYQEQDIEKAVELLKREYNIPLIFVSMGEKGSRVYYKDIMLEQNAFLQKETVDTTGAGDTFFGVCLHFILAKGINQLNKEDLKEMLLFANAAASIITTRKGALKVMPTVQEINEFLKKNMKV